MLLDWVQACLALCLCTARSSRQLAQNRSSNPGQQEEQQRQWGESSSEYAFNLVAFSDGRRGLVRIYTEMEPKYVKPIETGELSLPHVNQCHFQGNGTSSSEKTVLVDTQWAYGDETRIRTVNKVCLCLATKTHWTASSMHRGSIQTQQDP